MIVWRVVHENCQVGIAKETPNSHHAPAFNTIYHINKCTYAYHNYHVGLGMRVWRVVHGLEGGKTAG